jgi:hypothetical protein
MKVTCQKNRGAEVSATALARFAVSRDVVWPLEIGTDYEVSSVCVYIDGSVAYYVEPDLGWKPAELFVVADNTLYGAWACSHVRPGSLPNAPDICLLAGYPEMLSDPDQYIGLLEGDENARDIHRARLREAARIQFEDHVVATVAERIDRIRTGGLFSKPFVIRWGDARAREYDSLVGVEIQNAVDGHSSWATALAFVDGKPYAEVGEIAAELMSAIGAST